MRGMIPVMMELSVASETLERQLSWAHGGCEDALTIAIQVLVLTE